MDESDKSIEKRLSELESSVKEIKQLLQVPEIAKPAESIDRQESEIPEITAEIRPPVPPPPPATLVRELRPVKSVTPQKSLNIPDHMKSGEYWLNKAGIGLILFGVLFAFKYSVEQGWITPPVRHLFGLGVGLLLIGFGFKTYKKQRHFSLVLLGGAIGTFYMTGFSAYQLFSLVSHPVAMAYMVVVTILAFAISLRQNEPILSLIGTIGGLGTPFLLYSNSGNVEGLVIYTCLILAGTGVIYFFKGWRSLLWVSSIGGWIVLSIAADSSNNWKDAIDRKFWLVQGSVIFAWLIFWATPVIREVIWAVSPERWTNSSVGFADKLISQPLMKILDRHVHFLSISSPIIALIISLSLWPEIDDNIFGSCAIVVAIIYGAVSYYIKKWQPLTVLAQTHLAVAILFLTLGMIFLLDGNTLLVILATEALALHFIARRIDDKVMRVGSHILFSLLFFWMYDRLTVSRGIESTILDMRSLSDLLVIGVALSVAWVVRKKEERNSYLLIGALLLALWQVREFHEDIVVMTIMTEAVLLQYIGRRLNDKTLVDITSIATAIPIIWLFYRLTILEAEPVAVFNWASLADILTIGVLTFSPFILSNKGRRGIFLLAAHIALLCWMARELLSLEDGQGYLTIAWGVYAITLLLFGLRKDISRVRQVALGTIMLVVVKLFLIDLSRLETIWRVLLFVGFGGLLLIISYFFRSLWGGKSDTKPEVEKQD